MKPCFLVNNDPIVLNPGVNRVILGFVVLWDIISYKTLSYHIIDIKCSGGELQSKYQLLINGTVGAICLEFLKTS